VHTSVQLVWHMQLCTKTDNYAVKPVKKQCYLWEGAFLCQGLVTEQGEGLPSGQRSQGGMTEEKGTVRKTIQFFPPIHSCRIWGKFCEVMAMRVRSRHSCEEEVNLLMNYLKKITEVTRTEASDKT